MGERKQERSPRPRGVAWDKRLAKSVDEKDPVTKLASLYREQQLRAVSCWAREKLRIVDKKV